MKSFYLCRMENNQYEIHEAECGCVDNAVHVIDLGEFCSGSEAEVEAKIRGYCLVEICSMCIGENS